MSDLLNNEPLKRGWYKMWFLLLLRLEADKMLCLQHPPQPVLDEIIELPQKATMNGFALFKVK